MKNLIYLFLIAIIAASCNTADHSASTKAEANKVKFQKFYDDVLNAHNVAMVDSFCHPDFVDHNPDPNHTGKGTEDMKAALKEFFTAYPDLKIQTNFMIGQGDTIMSNITMSGTNSGPMGNMPATNKSFNIDGVDVIILKDGKAVERWGFFDMMKMMTQLGMMPEQGAMPDSAAKM